MDLRAAMNAVRRVAIGFRGYVENLVKSNGFNKIEIYGGDRPCVGHRLGHNALNIGGSASFGFFSPTTGQREKKSRSAKTIARTVTNWRRCYVC
jgi:hypothetical protein